MDLSSKRVLFIDLEKKIGEIKTFPDLIRYFGGVSMGFRLFELYKDLDPIIFSVGPLNGFFPYASKTSVVLNSDGVIEDIYLGGYLSTRLRFADLDALVLINRAESEINLELDNERVNFRDKETDLNSLGLPGRRSILELKNKRLILDEYFTEGENILAQKIAKKRVNGLVVSGTKSFRMRNPDKYVEIYKSLLQKTQQLTVEQGFFPSCSGCPMGCEKSVRGEMGGNVLVHSLVGCQFAEKIYSDAGIVFSCLNVLGYDYTHEDIENLPSLVQNTLRSIS